MTTRKIQPPTLRVAGAVGMLIGALAILAGSRVLSGLSVPGYTVLQPLVVYNVLAAGHVTLPIPAAVSR